MGAIQSLKSKLGPVLFQLPPRWHCNLERLESFLEALPDKYRYTFEFRDKSWFNDGVYQLLSDHKAAFCIYDMNGEVTPRILTADFVYVRLHGPAEKYSGNYTKTHLNMWAKRFVEWSRNGREIYCYFNNDLKGCAVKNAQTLLEILNE